MNAQGKEAGAAIETAGAELFPDHALSQQPPNFDLLAPFYRWMEWCSFGPWLWWCRCAFLGELRNARRGLILGDGDGRFTARLLCANPQVEVDAVDASAAMLRALVRRAGVNAARVHAQCRDARSWRAAQDAGYDLVATHFFLDCLSTAEVRELAAQVRAVATPQAVWVVSEFAIPRGRFGRQTARLVVGFLYWAFGVLTGLAVRRLPDHRSVFAQSGWRLEKRRQWLGGLLVSELWRHTGGAAEG